MVSLEICRLGFLCQQCNLDNGKKHQKTRCTEVLCVHVPCIWSLCPRAGSSVGQWARRKPLASPEPSGPPPASRGSGTEFIHRVSDARAPSVLHAYKHNPAPTTHWINREKRVFKTHLHRAVVIMAILSVIIKKDKCTIWHYTHYMSKYSTKRAATATQECPHCWYGFWNKRYVK